MKITIKQIIHNKTLISWLCVIISSFIMAMNINTFVNSGNLIPGGITGLSLLTQRTLTRFFNISIPYSFINIILNTLPAIIGFKMISKRFTFYSVIVIVLTSFLVDFLPSHRITSDPLLICLFGGLLNGLGISIALFGKASSGGTDFIAVYLNRRYNISAWNLILGYNIVILLAGGLLFGVEASLYSIVLQFVCTQVISTFNRANKKVTMLIITNHPELIEHKLMEATHHGITKWQATGVHEEKIRTLLYTVVSADEVGMVSYIVRENDNHAFINVLESSAVKGRFYQDPL